MSTPTTTSTASTTGYLPAHLTLLLGTVVIAATVFFLQGLGYPPTLTIGFLSLGGLIGFSIRLGRTDGIVRRVTSATLIWAGGVGLLGGVAYTIQTTDALLAPAVVPLSTYVGYGAVTASIDGNGDATGIRSITRSLTSIVYTGFFGALWVAVLMLPTGDIGSAIGASWTKASATATNPESPTAYLFGGILLTGAIYLMLYLAQRTPLDPLFDVRHIDNIDRLGHILRALRYGIALFIGGVGVYTGIRHTPEYNHLPDIASGLLTSPTIIQFSGATIVAGLLALFTQHVILHFISIDTTTVIERYGSAVIATVAIALTIPRYNPPLYSPLPEAVKSAPGVSTIIPQTPVPSGIILFALASFIGVFIIALPALLAETHYFDEVYTPIITVTLGLLGLGAMMGVADAGPTTSHLAIIMIALAILVWELGEYAITATGELQAGNTYPTGLTTLLTTRLIPSAALGALGVGIVFVLTTQLTRITLSDGRLATLTAVVGTLALALVYIILE